MVGRATVWLILASVLISAGNANLGAIPFVAMQLVVMGLIIAFPQLVMVMRPR